MSDEGVFQIWQCQKCGRRYMPQELDAIPLILDSPSLLLPNEVAAFEAEFSRIMATTPTERMPIILVTKDMTVKLTLACGHNSTDLVSPPYPTAAEMLGTPL